jgi:hypothetical protein
LISYFFQSKRVKSAAKIAPAVTGGLPKDYGINGFLPKGAPPIIPFPFGLLAGPKICFLFSLFLLKNKSGKTGGTGKANNDLFTNKKTKTWQTGAVTRWSS